MAPDDIHYRDAVVGDAEAISALVIASSRRWIAPDCTEEGAARLLDSMSPARVAERLHEGHRHVVAERDGCIVGVAALRLPTHLYYLFVADHLQRRGIARQLWERVRTGAAPGTPITVNASLHAFDAYLRLGFEPVGPARLAKGVRSVPMTWASR